MLSKEDSAKFQSMDIHRIPIDSLTDIGDITANVDEPLLTRYPKLLAQMGNPYFFRMGSMKICIGYMDENKSLEQAVKDYLNAVKTP